MNFKKTVVSGSEACHKRDSIVFSDEIQMHFSQESVNRTNNCLRSSAKRSIVVRSKLHWYLSMFAPLPESNACLPFNDLPNADGF